VLIPSHKAHGITYRLIGLDAPETGGSLPMRAGARARGPGNPTAAPAHRRWRARQMPRWSAERRAPYVSGRGTPR